MAGRFIVRSTAAPLTERFAVLGIFIVRNDVTVYSGGSSHFPLWSDTAYRHDAYRFGTMSEAKKVLRTLKRLDMKVAIVRFV